jgi:hypothetical protein
VVAVCSPSPFGPILFIFNNKSIIATVDLESKSPVGSSSNKISGSFERALAIATLYYSPPESSEGK